MGQDKVLDRATDLLTEGMNLHDTCNKIYLGHDVLAIAIQCHFVRVTLQEFDPGVWDAGKEIVDGFMVAKNEIEKAQSGVN